MNDQRSSVNFKWGRLLEYWNEFKHDIKLIASSAIQRTMKSLCLARSEWKRLMKYNNWETVHYSKTFLRDALEERQVKKNRQIVSVRECQNGARKHLLALKEIF